MKWELKRNVNVLYDFVSGGDPIFLGITDPPLDQVPYTGLTVDLSGNAGDNIYYLPGEDRVARLPGDGFPVCII